MTLLDDPEQTVLATVTQPRTEEEPETDQKQITMMLNAADLARFGAGDPVPAATDDTAQFEAPVISDAAMDDDFRSRPTADRPVFEVAGNHSTTPQVAPAKPRYAVILIIALISLLLLSATGFFVYSIYLKQQSPPPDVQQQPE